MLLLSGLYAIINELTGKTYIGSSVNVARRLRNHSDRLRRGVHDNINLQRAWQLDGGAAFTLRRVSECAPSELIAREQALVEDCREKGIALYNLRPVVDSQLGFRHSDETRAKFRAAKRVITPETRARMSASARRYAAEHPGEMARRRVGRLFTEEQKKKLRGRRSWNRGKTGLYAASAETRAKLSATGMGRPAWNLGVSPGEATIAKRRVGQKAAWARRSPEQRAAIGLKSWKTRRAASAVIG